MFRKELSLRQKVRDLHALDHVLMVPICHCSDNIRASISGRDRNVACKAAAGWWLSGKTRRLGKPSRPRTPHGNDLPFLATCMRGLASPAHYQYQVSHPLVSLGGLTRG